MKIAKYLEAIASPVLLLAGTEDMWPPEAQHRTMAELALNAEFKIFDVAGHFLPVEKSQ